MEKKMETTIVGYIGLRIIFLGMYLLGGPSTQKGFRV